MGKGKTTDGRPLIGKIELELDNQEEKQQTTKARNKN
jgi:hypothetical protein